MFRRLCLVVSMSAVLAFALIILSGCPAPAATPTPAVSSPTSAAVSSPTSAAVPSPTTAAASPTIAASPAATSSVASGQQLYAANCAACHGANGAGGVKIGNATSADLRQPELGPMYHNDNALLARAILDGKDEEGEDLDPAMPRFRGRLTDQQVNDIIAYIETLK